ncbi:MAG: PAS domain S-box protein [Cyanobacteria bacterium P01_A01_bin.45]
MKQDNSSTESLSNSEIENKTNQNKQQENFSAAFLFQVFESISEPIFIKNRQHEWVLLNNACCEFLGLTYEQAIGQSDYDLFSEEEANFLWEKDELVFSTGVMDESEESIKTKDGKQHFLSIKKCLFTDEEDNQFLMTQIRDITQRVKPYKKIEAQLQESKKILELVIDSVPQAMFWKDCNSVYKGCNQFFAEIAGVETPENIVGKSDYELFWNYDDIKWLRESDRRVIESGIPEYGNTYRRLQADGQPCWLEMNQVLLKNSHNEVVGILGSFQDVTERKELEVNLARFYKELEVRVEERTVKLKKAVRKLREEVKERQKVENKLRESQDLLRIVIDNIPQLIFWKDSSFVYSGCNTNFAKFFGWNSPSDIIGKTDDDLKLSKGQTQLNNEFRLMQLTESLPYQVEVQQQETAKKMWINISKIPLHNQKGNVIGILGSYENITERKEIEEVLRQTQSKFGRISANLPGMLYQFKMTAGGRLSFPYVSSGCYHLFGFTTDEIQADASLIVSAIHKEQQEKFADSIAASAQSLQVWEWEGKIVHKNGKTKWIRATSRPERQIDDSIIWNGVVLDVSHRNL